MSKLNPNIESATDSMGNTIVIGDYVLANIRDYSRTPSSRNSGTSRKMVRAHVKDFVGEGKVRLIIDNDIPTQHVASWVSQHHVTLLAPAEMADGYKEAFKYHTTQKGE